LCEDTMQYGMMRYLGSFLGFLQKVASFFEKKHLYDHFYFSLARNSQSSEDII
jgi:hypothetical protein